jgi:hypothetical protein
MLVGFGFVKCYINGTIVFNLTLIDHMHHLWDGFGRLREHNLKFHLINYWFFHTQVEYLGHMIYPSQLGV